MTGTPRLARGEFGHLLKWSPLVLLLGWLTVAELSGSTLPPDASLRTWPETTELERAQNIAASVPGDLAAQRWAAMMLVNVGRTDEAAGFLQDLLQRHPHYSKGHETLGEVHVVRGALNEARACYREALKAARNRSDGTMLHHRLGEICLMQQDYAAAEREFRAALSLDPDFAPTLATLEELSETMRISE